MSINNQKSFEVIGLMSGTSLDGVDLAYCVFHHQVSWEYEIIHATTIDYPKAWKQRLQQAGTLSGEALALLNVEYGHYLGAILQDFIQTINRKPQFISSHGHTVFHQPEKKFTLQIGDGAAMAALTRIPVVNQFRNMDVALGGQGAPLVPIGDALLFRDYDICLNLGGIANLSYEQHQQRKAYDISVCNMALNTLAASFGQFYDKDGDTARSGKMSENLYKQLNALDYYKQSFPKSLGMEWFDTFFAPIIEKNDDRVEDQLYTICKHIAHQIARVVNPLQQKNMFVTGGGAWNTFLIDCIKEAVNVAVVIPDAHIVNYKESLIFAFLGVLRMMHLPNCLHSVTGAARDHAGGAVYWAE